MEENDDDITDNDLICPNVCGIILEKVIDFCAYYVEVEPMIEIKTPFKSDTPSLLDIVTQDWYRKFVENMTREEVFLLIRAANYLDIQPLLKLSVLVMCIDINNTSMEELQSNFSITPPAAPEQSRVCRPKNSTQWNE